MELRIARIADDNVNSIPAVRIELWGEGDTRFDGVLVGTTVEELGLAVDDTLDVPGLEVPEQPEAVATEGQPVGAAEEPEEE